nr:pilus assembly protein TadG-related protein [Mesorhizobium albiziae]
MIRRFLGDRRGNFAMLTAIAMVPIMGALTLAIDYGEMSRQRQLMLNSLDAAGIATARELVSGATDAKLTTYATDFFQSNLSKAINPADTTLTVVLPQNNTGGGTLKLCSKLVYHPYFVPVFYMLIKKAEEEISFNACTEVRLKNTLEVALVLDNSGSMSEKGKGSTKTRLELLKDASTKLVDTIAKEGETLKQIDKPVQFGLVPFAASVNVGPGNAMDSAGLPKSWMDGLGISPVHHENFDWRKVRDGELGAQKKVEQNGNGWIKKGTDWGSSNGKPATRFSLYEDIQTLSGEKVAWKGCVEARPSPYNNDDTLPTASNPATLFVPMFAPDEPDRVEDDDDYLYGTYGNSWWPDRLADTVRHRQEDVQKYFRKASSFGASGPNQSCTTTPITSLQDVTKGSGKDDVKAAINAMQATGNTNVPEGMAWGWRVVSHGEPFTEGRPDNERGNDKVVIVLTDGENTYGDLNDSTYNDPLRNRSTYAAYAYAGKAYNGGDSRIFKDTSVSKTTFTADNYNAAMNQHFKKLCDNAKAPKTQGGNDPHVIVMTVALDLNASDNYEKRQIDALQDCASFSRVNPEKKLFWNATGGELEKVFKEIADELSNLRIVS